MPQIHSFLSWHLLPAWSGRLTSGGPGSPWTAPTHNTRDCAIMSTVDVTRSGLHSSPARVPSCCPLLLVPAALFATRHLLSLPHRILPISKEPFRNSVVKYTAYKVHCCSQGEGHMAPRRTCTPTQRGTRLQNPQPPTDSPRWVQCVGRARCPLRNAGGAWCPH